MSSGPCKSEILSHVLKLAAEKELRDRMRKIITEQLDIVVEGLLEDFQKEFRPQVQAFLERDAGCMMTNAVVRVNYNKKEKNLYE